MKKFYAIISLLTFYIFLGFAGSVLADGDYYDYSQSISAGNDVYYFESSDGNTIGAMVEIEEQISGSIVPVTDEFQAVNIIQVDGYFSGIMITNLTSEQQTAYVQVGGHGWMVKIESNSGIVMLSDFLIDSGPPQPFKLFTSPDVLLLTSEFVKK